MGPGLSLLLSTTIGYFVSMEAGLRVQEMLDRSQQKLDTELARTDAMRDALASRRTLGDDIATVCAELARSRDTLGITATEEPLWRLLSDQTFHGDLTEWFMVGGIAEGAAVKSRLVATMRSALQAAGATEQRIASLTTEYLDGVGRAILAHPVLAHWRHQLSLDYLREQVAELKALAQEAVGVYSEEKQQAATEDYCEKALRAWGIIDTATLPEGDVLMATQKLLLRELYIPLRVEVEAAREGHRGAADLDSLEEKRASRRDREAGRSGSREGDVEPSSTDTHPVGRRLGESGRLVVLGDPGSGKTTMLRWLATVYLQRLQGDEAVADMPDIETLSANPLLSVLIRCRELGEEYLCRDFTWFLTQHLRRTELLPADADVMQAVVLDGIANGDVLLLVDGLDEITNPRVRSLFCQELERIAVRYPDAPIVVTSRIVGYRDMPYRMGAGFEHDVIADLTPEDKDGFARKWVEVTEDHLTAADQERQVDELIDALHSTDRIERLTGNPMLLTTLTLVKRKVGKLPNRRADLYREAVGVLLNWNPNHPTIDAKEAMPQLEYVAYEMCRLGVQRLTKDDILGLLDGVREDYPNIRAIRNRTSEQFLDLLEARSSILIESGAAWQDGDSEEPVWEFRHLTLQEYLASRALLEGRYRGHDGTVSLADQVAELGRPTPDGPFNRPEVPESWREALRLVVADCKSDDVDNILLGILTPRDDEDPARTARGRAVLAGLCLADEPDASDEVGQWVLVDFAAVVASPDGTGRINTSLAASALEIGESMWASRLRDALVEEFRRRGPANREEPGGLWGKVEVARWGGSTEAAQEFCDGAPALIRSGNTAESIAATLVIMEAAFEERTVVGDDLVDSLLGMLAAADPPVVHAAAWALWWLRGGRRPGEVHSPERALFPALPSAGVRTIADAAARVGIAEGTTACMLAWLLVTATDPGSALVIAPLLYSGHASVRMSAYAVLGVMGGQDAVAALRVRLGDDDENVRRAAVEALATTGDVDAVRRLLEMLDEEEDEDEDVRRAVIEALGWTGDPALVPALSAMREDGDFREQSSSAVGHRLGQGRLDLLRASDTASGGRDLVRSYARDKGKADRRLLSLEVDGIGPWLGPGNPITSERVEDVVEDLGLDLDASEVRARYEAMAPDLDLELTWLTSD